MVSARQRIEPDRGWIILRTSGPKTMRLAASLEEDGYEVWTPSTVRRVRVPRANVRRDVRFPITPSFIFARGRHLFDLLALAAMPEKPRRGVGGRQPAHSDFTVFRFCDRIPVISDAALGPLREAEGRVHVEMLRRYRTGATVRVPDGSFGGLAGTVLRSNAKKTLVSFGDLRVRISTFILEPDDANALEPEEGAAAEAAQASGRCPLGPKYALATRMDR